MIEDIKKAPLNQTYTDMELQNQCKFIYGAVSWPAKRPGFAVIIAMLYEKHFDTHDIYLLAEFESFNTRELVRQCGALDLQYKPLTWIGDDHNNAADRFIEEMADEQRNPTRRVARRQFSVYPTTMLEMNQFYAYALPYLRNQLEPERKLLYLKTSKAVDYLADIEEKEIADLELGDFPAIEALAFAVIEMRKDHPPKKPANNDTRSHTPRSAMA